MRNFYVKPEEIQSVRWSSKQNLSVRISEKSSSKSQLKKNSSKSQLKKSSSKSQLKEGSSKSQRKKSSDESLQ